MSMLMKLIVKNVMPINSDIQKDLNTISNVKVSPEWFPIVDIIKIKNNAGSVINFISFETIDVIWRELKIVWIWKMNILAEIVLMNTLMKMKMDIAQNILLILGAIFILFLKDKFSVMLKLIVKLVWKITTQMKMVFVN